MPRNAWSKKDERMDRKINRSTNEAGEASAKRAEEIAARTVNKRRRLEGRTQAPRAPRKTREQSTR